MKIVYSIGTTVGAGGLGVDSLEALRAIYAKGYLAKVVAYGNRQSEIPASLFRCVGIFNPTRIFANLPARYYYPIKRKYLDRLARRELARGADLFHGWSSSSLESLRFCRENGIVSFLENPGPHCRYAEAIVDEEFAELGIRRRSRPEILERFFGQDEEYHLAEYEEAGRIIVESRFTGETFLSHGIPAEKLVLAPRGVDTVRFTPPAARERGCFRVLFVGNIGVRKGARYLLEAWSALRLKNAELVLTGGVGGEFEPILRDRMARDPSIRLAGFVPDPVRSYQGASVFVFPSLSEGSAKVTYEAMACGLPVVVTPNAGSVAVDGEHGFLVPARNRDALAEKILFLYENEEAREAMGVQARRHIESYTWENHRKILVDIYERAWAGDSLQDRRI